MTPGVAPRDFFGPVEDFHASVEMFDQRIASFDPIAIVPVFDAVEVAKFRGVNVAAYHPVDAAFGGGICIHPNPDGSLRVPIVDEDECVGCNLCALVCPVEGCITMVEKRKAPEPITWNDRIRAGTDLVPGGLDATQKARGAQADSGAE